MRLVVHAFSGRVDVWSLDMDAQDARHPPVDRMAHGSDRARDGRAIGGDQGRQEAGGAVTPVRRADPRDGRGLGGIVEQRAAAAVDLEVDEARRQQAALEVDAARAVRQPRIVDNALDPSVREQQGAAAGQPAVQQNLAIDQSVQAGSCVRLPRGSDS